MTCKMGQGHEAQSGNPGKLDFDKESQRGTRVLCWEGSGVREDKGGLGKGWGTGEWTWTWTWTGIDW